MFLNVEILGRGWSEPASAWPEKEISAVITTGQYYLPLMQALSSYLGLIFSILLV